MNLTPVLKRPIITEKALNQSTLGKYIFEVERRATKAEIKRAINQAFGVDVIAVKTINLGGKNRRFGRKRTQVKLGDWKKAIVQLAPGQKIDVFTVPGEAEGKSSPSKKDKETKKEAKR
jgi:large subunit ribosomal protein L23